MSVNKREIEREVGAEKTFRYRSVALQILPLNCMRRMFFSSSDCMYCMFIKISECVSLNVSLYTSISLWPRPTTKKKKCQWTCVLNVFHDCTGLVANPHTWVLPRRVRFWYSMTLSSNLHLCLFQCSVVSSVLSVFGELSNSAKFKCYRHVRSKLWPGCRVLRSLGGVYNLAKPHCEAKKRSYDHNLSLLNILVNSSAPLLHTPTQTISVHWFLWKRF